MDKKEKSFESRMKESLKFVGSRMDESMKVPGDFADKVWGRIGEPNPSLASRLRRLLLSGKGLAAACACAVILVAVIFINKIYKPGIITAGKPASRENIAMNQGSSGNAVKEKQAVIAQGKYAEITVPQPTRQTSGNENNQKPPALAAINPAVNNQQAEPNQAKAMNAALNSRANAAAVNTGNKQVSSAGMQKQTPDNDVKSNTETPSGVSFGIKNNLIHPLNGDMTELDYTAPPECNVTIKIYDRKGRLIKDIFSGSGQPGSHTEYWKGDDSNGAVVDAGIYIVYIKICSFEKEETVGVVK